MILAPYCCCDGNCVPKFLDIRIRHNGFTALGFSPGTLPAFSYKRYLSKTFSYVDNNGVFFNVVMHIHKLTGRATWEESTNATDDYRPTVFSRINSHFEQNRAANNYNAGEILAASGHYEQGSTFYDWTLEVFNEYEWDEFVLDTEDFVLGARLALDDIPANSITEYKRAIPEGNPSEASLAGAFEPRNLAVHNADGIGEITITTTSAEQYWITWAIWWQLQYVTPPNPPNDPLFDVSKYRCTFASEFVPGSANTGSAGNDLGYIYVFIARIESGVPMCATVTMNETGLFPFSPIITEECFGGFTNEFRSPMPEVLAFNKTKRPTIMYLTSPGYVDAETGCPCSAAP